MSFCATTKKDVDGREQAHGCPAQILLCKVHGIDSNGVQSFATQLDMKRISAVPHTNTVFRDILKLVPWSEVRQACEEPRERRAGAQFHDETSISGTFVRPIVGRQFAARYRGRDEEPSGAALSCGRPGACTFDLRGRQPQPQPGGFLGSFHAYAGHDDARLGAASWAMPCGWSTRPACIWRAPALIGRAFPPMSAAPRRMWSTIPISVARSIT